jgi:hypothetical protein
MTALGPVRLTRNYAVDPAGEGGYPADLALGLDGFLTRQATRLATLAGVEHSFARAQQVLNEFCGWQVDDEVIRKTTHAQAKRATRERPSRSDAAAFAEASGGVEVLIDAGKVNTLDGWRDVKIGLFLRRNPGSPATPAEWDTRRLPDPTTRTLVAAIEECDAFGTRLRREADRLRITATPNISVLGDGAEWIWNLADEHLPQAQGTLDVFHAIEHVADAVKGVWGGENPATTTHIEAGRKALLAEGRPGLDRWLGDLFPHVPAGVSTSPLIGLAAYFAKHPTRLNYAERLAKGQSIGSGAIEGAIKQNVNLRLKRTGARWRVDSVGPLVELRALSYTQDWQSHWNAA